MNNLTLQRSFGTRLQRSDPPVEFTRQSPPMRPVLLVLLIIPHAVLSDATGELTEALQDIPRSLATVLQQVQERLPITPVPRRNLMITITTTDFIAHIKSLTVYGLLQLVQQLKEVFGTGRRRLLATPGKEFQGGPTRRRLLASLTQEQVIVHVQSLCQAEMEELVAAISEEFGPPSAAPTPCPAPSGGNCEYTVRLRNFGHKKINVIKALRGALSISLRAAKNLDAPVDVFTDVDKVRAQQIEKELYEAGAETLLLTECSLSAGPSPAPTVPTTSPSPFPTASPSSTPTDPTTSPSSAPTAPIDPTTTPSSAPSDPTASPSSAPSDPTTSPVPAPTDQTARHSPDPTGRPRRSRCVSPWPVTRWEPLAELLWPIWELLDTQTRAAIQFVDCTFQ